MKIKISATIAAALCLVQLVQAENRLRLAMCLILCGSVVSSARAAGNLIPNGDFESGTLSGWRQEKPGFSPDDSVAHSGRWSLKAVASATSPQTLMSDKIVFEMNTVFTLSLWIKSDAISKADGISVKILQQNDSTGWRSWYPTLPTQHPDDGYARHPSGGKAIKAGGTADWTEYRLSFEPDPAAESFQIVLSLDEGAAGAAWFDDVVLTSTSMRIAQRDFTGQWHNTKLWGDQVRWTEQNQAADELEITLQEGEYHVWLSMLGGGHPDIEVELDGKKLGTGDGTQPTGWRNFDAVSVGTGLHKFTLTSKDPKGLNNKAAYAGMIIASDPKTVLPDPAALRSLLPSDCAALNAWPPLGHLTPAYEAPLESPPVELYPPKPSDKNLIVAVGAVLTPTGWVGAKGLPSSGAARIAAIAHKYKIPVTWLVSNDSAVRMKDLLTKWHNEFGDDVGSSDFKDWAPLKAALPWAETNFASVGAGYTRPVGELEDAGMLGAWGWCWEQEGVDNTADKGCPWAPFYASRGNNNLNYKIPANYPGKVLAIQWLQRDLSKALDLHTGDGCVFSTDPDDVRRGHIVYGRSAEYMKQMLDEYLRNTEWNDCIPYILQQESHEMEWSSSWIMDLSRVPGGDETAALAGSRKAVNLDAQAMDEFFKYAKSKNVTFMTLAQLAEYYQKKYPGAAPAQYMLCRDIPTQEPVSYYATPGAPYHPGPYPALTFSYFDAECQIVIENQERVPKRIFNYLRQIPAGYDRPYPREEKIPGIKSFDKESAPGKEIWKIIVANANDYIEPMGIAEWGDFSKYEKVKASDNVKEVKMIGNHLAFIRFNAAAGGDTEMRLEFKVGKKGHQKKR